MPVSSQFQKLCHFSRRILRFFARIWRKHCIYRILFVLLGFIIGISMVMFGISRWYLASNSDQRFKMGVTFIPAYAASLGVDPQAAMDALIDDVGVRQFRLTSYWNQIEHTEGQYDFTELDWQFKKAEATKATISLAIGLRQPRWPECHVPDWAADKQVADIQPQLDAYISAVVNRYKNSPSLGNYQLENEFFNDFGECTDFNRERLKHEYNLVKKLDSKHPIIVTKSNNFPVAATGQPQPDIVGISIYRRVWDANITKNYMNYPLPAWYYGANAGVQKILTGKDSVVHELQMESWPPNGKFIANISVEEQNKSMNASMFAERINFAKSTGMRSADLWGAEWWYYRKIVEKDPSLWNEAKTAFRNN
jgi:hypothetical protein